MAISLDPQLTSPYIYRAWAYRELGLNDRAVQDCNRALRLNSTNALAYFNRAMAYEGKGEVRNALKDFEKACSLGWASACDRLKKMQKMARKAQKGQPKDKPKGKKYP